MESAASSSNNRHVFKSIQMILDAEGEPFVKNGAYEFIDAENKEFVNITVGFINFDKEIQILDVEDLNTTFLVHVKKKIPVASVTMTINNPTQPEPNKNHNETYSSVPATEATLKVETGGFSCTSSADLNVRSPANEGDKPNVIKIDWPRNMTKFLITQYDTYKELLKTRKMKTRTEIWKRISCDLASRGFTATPDPVRNKWGSMNRSYKNMTDHNRKTGSD